MSRNHLRKVAAAEPHVQIGVIARCKRPDTAALIASHTPYDHVRRFAQKRVQEVVEKANFHVHVVEARREGPNEG